MTIDEIIYECDICSQEFHEYHEAVEHVIYNHELVKDRISVHDPRNRVEPGGL